MSPDSRSPRDQLGGSSHDPEPDRPARLLETIRWDSGPISTTVSYSSEVAPPEPVWLVEHDRDRGLFRLTGPDGQTECFRQEPSRYLVVEPDLETGEMRPEV